MSNPIHAVFLIVVLALWIGPSILVARFAERKGRSFAVYLVACLLIWWPVPLLVVALMPSQHQRVA